MRVPVEGLLGQGQVAVLQQQLVSCQTGPLPFCPPVLIPGLDLCVGQIQFCGQFLSVLNRKILLLFKTPLQGLELIVAEGGASLPLFPLQRCLARVGVGRVLIICNKIN